MGRPLWWRLGKESVVRDETQETGLEFLERLIARAFVFCGGFFWAIAGFAGPYVYHRMSFTSSVNSALWPFLAAVVILFIGWTYERLAAVLLFGAAAAVIVWGTLYDWEAGVWLIMAFVLIAPMLIAGVLFLLSSRAEEERARAEERQALPVEPSHAFAEALNRVTESPARAR